MKKFFQVTFYIMPVTVKALLDVICSKEFWSPTTAVSLSLPVGLYFREQDLFIRKLFFSRPLPILISLHFFSICVLPWYLALLLPLFLGDSCVQQESGDCTQFLGCLELVYEENSRCRQPPPLHTDSTSFTELFYLDPMPCLAHMVI